MPAGSMVAMRRDNLSSPVITLAAFYGSGKRLVAASH
jgi:hypothetical protein